MIKIKDYLALKEILDYLINQKIEKEEENNGFSNNPIEKLNSMITDLNNILNKLENED